MTSQSLSLSVQPAIVGLTVAPTVAEVAIGHGYPVVIQQGGGSTYTTTFTDAALTIADLLPVTHNLGANPSGVFVQDANGVYVIPDSITVLSLNALAIGLGSFRPLINTWRVQIIA